MPRIQIGQPLADYSEIIDTLYKEIHGITNGGEPAIYEKNVPLSDHFHVVVVWSKWDGVPADVRPSIIQEAYERHDPETARKVVVTLGVTMGEGISFHVLPHRILFISGDSVESRKNAKKEFIKLGGEIHRNNWMLAYPTRENAEVALKQLSKIYGTQWKLESSPSDSD
jgi:hypothetical protein